LPGGSSPREEDSARTRVSQNWTEGGGYGAVHIDQPNMPLDSRPSNAGADMSAMRLAHRKVSDAARSRARDWRENAAQIRKRYGPALEGAAGPSCRQSCRLLVQTVAPGREEKTPPFVDCLCSVSDRRYKTTPPCAERMARGHGAKAETRNSVSRPPSWYSTSSSFHWSLTCFSTSVSVQLASGASGNL
jgi:hypothetical protein